MDTPTDERRNPNPFIGIILLMVLVVFVLPNRLPRFIADLSPYLFAGIPCGRLPAPANLAAHQSAIGRSVQDPLRLDLTATAIDDDGAFLVRLTMINQSLGTVPIVFQEDNIVVAASDDSGNGLGFIINPAPASGLQDRPDSETNIFEESDIRLLGPRQRCVHSLELVASQQMIDDGGTVSAWYRMTEPGEHGPQSEGTRAIYPDQGLDIMRDGTVFSPQVAVEAA